MLSSDGCIDQLPSSYSSSNPAIAQFPADRNIALPIPYGVFGCAFIKPIITGTINVISSLFLTGAVTMNSGCLS